MKVNYDGHTHEHEFEPEYGLPEPLPAGERVLWQGSPDWRVLARHVFHVRTLALYFAAILVIRGAFVLSDGGTATAALKAVGMTLPLVVMAIGIALGLAILCARTSVYTITDKRVTMRIGIVLNLTFNLPFKRIAGAGYRQIGHGAGDIPLTLAGTDQIAYLHLWPHARPWRIAKAEPMLRCVPHGEEVARVLGQAWSQSRGIELNPMAPSPTSAPRQRGFNVSSEPRLTQGA